MQNMSHPVILPNAWDANVCNDNTKKLIDLKLLFAKTTLKCAIKIIVIRIIFQSIAVATLHLNQRN